MIETGQDAFHATGVVGSNSASITVDAVIDALAEFLQQFAPNAQIVRGSNNRVPLPAAPCMVLQEIVRTPLETPGADYDYANNRVIFTTPKQIEIQIDCYGETAGDVSEAFTSAYRTLWAADQFPSGIAPLYCTESRRMPHVTGEQQYLDRWTVTAALQYNADVVTPQPFFNTAGSVTTLAQTTYPA